jgi:hypothetical protein
MPTDTNLPTMVHLYLELIEKLMSMTTDYDSGSKEISLIHYEIEFYFGKIKNIMDKAQIENE